MAETNNIRIIYDSRNYTVLEHYGKIYCYSYQNVIAYYDGQQVHSRPNEELTQTNKKHIGLFKKLIESKGIKQDE